MGLFCPYNRGSLSIIIEPPVRASPNQKYSSIYVQKRQNGGRNTQKALRVPFLFQLADFAGGGEGRVISGRLANRCGSGLSTPKDYLNTIFG